MKYTAFLRGINVGGYKTVKMAQLVSLFSDLGFKKVKTFLNSGNVVFANESKGTEESEESEVIQRQIEQALKKKFGFEITVILRTVEEIKELVGSDPFKETKINPDRRLYVTFLPDKEIFSVVDLSQQGTTDLMKSIDKQYGKLSTTRNWNTVNKIAEKG